MAALSHLIERRRGELCIGELPFDAGPTTTPQDSLSDGGSSFRFWRITAAGASIGIQPVASP